MEYADKHTDFDRFDDSVQTLLEGIVFNRQLWSGDADADTVTDALKYHQRPVQRPDYQPYAGDDPYIQEILNDVLGFEGLIPFQEQCWSLLHEMQDTRVRENNSRGAILSAPTGFGKTEGFAGPVFHDHAMNNGKGFGKVAIVYPRNALLEDQLERFLVTIHKMNRRHNADISIGIYNGDVRPSNGDIFRSPLINQGEFTIAQWTGGDEPVPFNFNYDRNNETYTLDASRGPTFSERTIKLSRDAVRNDVPDILLTTINSLENFALKPNYDIIDEFRTIIFDEVHLYRGTYGAHAANVIRNTKRSIEERVGDEAGMLFIGSSATIDRPKQFGSDLFDINRENIAVVETSPEDKRESDDTEHFHFVASNEDVATSSTFIQQILLFSHALLQESDGRDRKKALAFIDSVSQVNQRYFQIRDFERENRWQYHDKAPDDWRQIAQETPYQTALPAQTTPGHEFIENDFNIQQTSADLRLRAEEFGETDLILSTSLLEVGIDIPAIKVISQYRAPWEMSQFVQRIGRASRKEGNDAHFLITLGDEAADRSLFHRAGSFLDPEITTPLNTDNEILTWIHSQLYKAFQTVYRIRSAVTTGGSTQQQEKFLEYFLRRSDEESFQAFGQFIEEPGTELTSLLEQRLPISGSLNDLETIDAVYSTVLQAVQDDALLTDIATLLDEPVTRFTLQTGRLDDLDDQMEIGIRMTIQEVRNTINQAEPQNTAARGAVDAISNQLSEAETILDDGGQDRRDRYDDLDELFNNVRNQLSSVASDFTGVHESFPYHLRLEDANSAIQEARGIRRDEQLQDKRQRWRRAYYVKRALQEYYCFVNQRFSDNQVYGHLMVRAFKALLRAVYFYDRAVNLESTRGELEPPHFVPTSYFGEAGETFSVVPEDQAGAPGEEDSIDALYVIRFEQNDDDEEQLDASLTKLFFEYAPYMSKYLSDQSLQMFNPQVEEAPVDADADYYFDISGLSTEPGEDLVTPNTLPVKQVEDQSGDQARAIVWYCNESLYVGRNRWDHGPHGEDTMDYGQLHSEPHIGTAFEPEERPTDQISVSYIDADVSLDAVTLTITPATLVGDPSAESPPFRTERDAQRELLLEFEQPLGFSLHSRGVIWDIGDFVDELLEDEEFVENFESHNPGADIEDTIHFTAAHFLVEVVADVSGVNQAQMLYAVSPDANQVAVFEHAEGGQGIVDLFDDVRNRLEHEKMLRTINRVASNPQLINGSLWADNEFVVAVRAGDWATVEEFVRQRVVVPTESVVNDVMQMVQNTVDQLDEFADVTDTTLEEAYEIRHAAARYQFEVGIHDPVEDLEDETPDSVQAENLRNLIVEPDVDDCVENLHLAYSIVMDQGNVLSYLVLERLHEHVVTKTDSDDWGDEVLDREAIPGVNIDGTNVFHTL
ncbi:DEAD/DEAH box helicase [Halovivax gelatinilyticus]|uniref:DEAD/DEAH box helicase n=1 Tax=Halovivax gelatinilyticus TaxID=2961597 RepID=UPI0020CA31B6|nr:DEAD/DEAH box helicase [Halovivax gelatinilyticus]